MLTFLSVGPFFRIGGGGVQKFSARILRLFSIDVAPNHFLSVILLSQFVSINIYRSSSGSIPEALTALKVLIDNSKPNLITGDLNLCFTKNGTNSITKGLQDSGFKQLVTEATHIQGGLIDHVYWRDERSPRFEDPKVEIQPILF